MSRRGSGKPLSIEKIAIVYDWHESNNKGVSVRQKRKPVCPVGPVQTYEGKTFETEN